MDAVPTQVTDKPLKEVKTLRPAAVRPYRSTRHKRRHRRERSRIANHLKRYVKPSTPIADPLKREKSTLASRLSVPAGLFLAALVVHVLVLAMFYGVGAVAEAFETPVKKAAQSITMQITKPPPPEPEAPEELPATPKPAPEVQRKRPKARPKKVPSIEPDPVNIAPEPPAPSTKKKRRVIGLNFSSTVSGGKGPSFAVGNTRMGATQRVAEDASQVEVLEPGTNRVASRIPIAGQIRTKPKRLKEIKPTYPKLLREQGIEADVTVSISVSKQGKVTKVRVIKGAPYEEFNQAAIDAANKQFFQPATRNGLPIDYILKYTYRFRLNET
jgi:TonB family protein